MPYLSGKRPRPSETVKVTYPNPQQAVLEVTLESPGLVVLADIYYPGLGTHDRRQARADLSSQRLDAWGRGAGESPSTCLIHMLPGHFGSANSSRSAGWRVIRRFLGWCVLFGLSIRCWGPALQVPINQRRGASAAMDRKHDRAFRPVPCVGKEPGMTSPFRADNGSRAPQPSRATCR